MIVSCPNCSKKFNISENLIPENGRLLQCSNCNHKWHYQIAIETDSADQTIKLTDKLEIINEKKISPKKTKNKKSSQKTKSTKKNDYKKDKETNLKNKSKNNNSNEKNITLFNLLFITIISLIAIIIILDTFKLQISNYVPIIIPLLDNLYNIFFDIYSFIKDLTR